MKTVHDLWIVRLDGQFATAIEASRGEIDGANDGPDSIGEEQLGMKLEALSLLHLNADIVQNSQATTPSTSFSFFSLCGGRART